MNSREDWLNDQLDRDDLTSAQRSKYEAELDAIAKRYSDRQAKIGAVHAAEKARTAEIRAQILAGNTDIIETFGVEEFGSDYEEVVEGSNYVVYSKVATDAQNNRHVFNSKDEAHAKFRKLVWDRLYSKYVRSGELSHLSELVS